MSVGRKHIGYAEERAPSYVPNKMLYSRDSNKESILNEPTIQCLKDLRVKTSVSLIKELKDDIENHCDMRIQLFLQQLILVYDTKATYSCGDTDKQIGCAGYGKKQREKMLRLSKPDSDKELQEKSCFNAAHSSTITNLMRKNTSQVEPVSYVHDSWLNDMWNSTVLLPTVINIGIDCRLDGHNNEHKEGADKRLRQRAIEILNVTAAAQDAYTPKTGLIEFLKGFNEVIQVAKAEFSNEKKQLEKTKDKNQKNADKEAILNNKIKLIVLDNYNEVVNWYSQVLEDEEKSVEVIKKLCMCTADKTDEVAGDFFKKVQGKILSSVDQSESAEKVTIHSEKVVTRSKTTKTVSTTAKVEKVALSKLEALGPAGSKYKAFCVKNEDVKEIADDYRKSNVAKKEVQAKIKEVIRVKYDKNAQRIDLITDHVLSELCR
jgi:hypothetical protein